jgi:hypothetical protein
VSFLLPRTCPLLLSTLSSLWLAHNAPNVRRLQQKCHRLRPWKRTQKLAFFPLPAARKCQSSSGLNENLTHIRSSLKSTAADVKIANGTTCTRDSSHVTALFQAANGSADSVYT